MSENYRGNQEMLYGSAVRDLGCSIEEFKKHLEKQFVKGMMWSNYGKGKDKWQIGHIIPFCVVDLTDRKQFLEVCHYTNLRPLWHSENCGRRYGEFR